MQLEDVLALEPAALRCPYQAYSEEQSAGVSFSAAADAYVVSRHEDAVTVLRDVATFSSSIATGRPAPPADSEMAKYVPYLLLSDEPEHARRRAIVSRSLTPARVAAWEPRIRELCTDLVDGFAGKETIEFLEAFAVPLPITVISAVLGVPDGDLAAFRRWSEELASFVGSHHVDPADIFRVAKQFTANLDPLLDAAGAREHTDIMAIVAATEAAGELPRHDAARFVLELIVAGNITTTDHLASSMLLLAQAPRLAADLRRDPSLIPRFIEESLRLEAPIQGLYRLATRDAIVGETTIPAGSRVLVLYAAANRDPQAWRNADGLQLDRPNPATHLAFGRGAHACLGAALARAESRIALEVLLQRIRHVELAVDADDVEFLPSTVNRGPARLPLRLTW